MIIDLPNGGKAKLIGDPHLGLKFEVGVPLHRRGEREQKQFANFLSALDIPYVRFNICVGDLFEHPFVGHGVVVQTAEAYLAAAQKHPEIQFVVLAGNHDRSRNIGVSGAWESFRTMVEDRYDNLHTIEEPSLWDEFVFSPWQWNMGAEQGLEYLLSEHSIDGSEPLVAVGHWDLKSYGGDDSHLCPVKILKKGFKVERIYGGHYHTAGIYVVGGEAVTCTGSLEPYSHGEDPDGEIYTTVPLAAVEADPAAFKNKCVRIQLAPGETLPDDLDCLAVTRQFISAPDNDGSIPETVATNGFDWDKIVEEELKQIDDPEVVTIIKDRLGLKS